MKKIFFAILFTAAFSNISFADNAKQMRVLVYYKTNGWRHDCIPAGIAAIQKLGRENNFAVDTTADSSAFTKENLKKYAAVIFLNTTGNVLNNEQQKIFEDYIENGGGFVGVHSATDTEYDWPWYNKLVGAYFKDHPKQQYAVLHVVDSNFIATKKLPATWKRFDEWYNFKQTKWDSVHVLITIDETSYTGGENGSFHPMSWYHNYDGGRAFYTELGHTIESYSDPLYLSHLLGGIEYAMKGTMH
ncbi:MAG: ThuA domain-containing protein [Chitinophagaceae bacterium]